MSQENQIEYNKKHVAFVFDTDNVSAVLVTEDGNVFKADAKGRSFCKDHCRRLDIKFREVTREEFETENPKTDEPKKVVPLSKMNKTELLAICAEKGIETSEDDTKAILVKLIEDAEKEPSSEGANGSEGGNENGSQEGNENSTTDNTAE